MALNFFADCSNLNISYFEGRGSFDHNPTDFEALNCHGSNVNLENRENNPLYTVGNLGCWYCGFGQQLVYYASRRKADCVCVSTVAMRRKLTLLLSLQNLV